MTLTLTTAQGCNTVVMMMYTKNIHTREQFNYMKMQGNIVLFRIFSINKMYLMT